jgi:hypothetical protein
VSCEVRTELLQCCLKEYQVPLPIALLGLIAYRRVTAAGTSFMTSGYILSKCLVRYAVMWVAYSEAR